MSKASTQRNSKRRSPNGRRLALTRPGNRVSAAAGKRKRAAYLVKSASPEEIARGIRASRAQREYAARIAAMVTSSGS